MQSYLSNNSNDFSTLPKKKSPPMNEKARITPPLSAAVLKSLSSGSRGHSYSPKVSRTRRGNISDENSVKIIENEIIIHTTYRENQSSTFPRSKLNKENDYSDVAYHVNSPSKSRRVMEEMRSGYTSNSTASSPLCRSFNENSEMICTYLKNNNVNDNNNNKFIIGSYEDDGRVMDRMVSISKSQVETKSTSKTKNKEGKSSKGKKNTRDVGGNEIQIFMDDIINNSNGNQNSLDISLAKSFLLDLLISSDDVAFQNPINDSQINWNQETILLHFDIIKKEWLRRGNEIKKMEKEIRRLREEIPELKKELDVTFRSLSQSNSELRKANSIKQAALNKIEAEAKIMLHADLLIQKNQEMLQELQEERQARKSLQSMLTNRAMNSLDCDKNALKLLQDQHNAVLESEQLVIRLRDEIDKANSEKGEMFKEIVSCRNANKKLVNEIVRLNNELRMSSPKPDSRFQSQRIINFSEIGKEESMDDVNWKPLCLSQLQTMISAHFQNVHNQNTIQLDHDHTIPLVPPQWVPDGDSQTCRNCHRNFSFFRRRHHCRACGDLFCNSCANKKIPLTIFGLYKPVKVCKRCDATFLI